MEKKIILLWPFGFREYDWKRYELSELEERENFEVEVHELVNFLIPNFISAYQKLLINEKVKKFKNFFEWKNYINSQVQEANKNKKELLILKHSLNNNLNLNFLLINREIKKLKLKTLELFGSSHPVMILKKKFDTIYFIRSLYHHLKNTNILIFNLKKYFFNLIYLNFYKKSDILLTFNKYIPKKLTHDTTNIIKANSFDYSMSLKNIKVQKGLKKNSNYALFLEAPTPLFPGDELIWGGQNEGFTKEKWFPSLRKYFDDLEKILNLKVVIAPHPKVKHEKRPPYYGGREISDLDLADSALNSDLIISHWSSGLAFGVIYNKPIMLITSNELIKNEEFVRQQVLFSKELGSEIINIDKKINTKEIKKVLKINTSKYNEYLYNYCTTRTDKKRNYQIISDIFKNKAI